MSDTDLEARLSALEEAVARLSAQEAVGQATLPQPTQGELFWALDGLEARAPKGAVLYTGSVTTPAGSVVRWQYAQTAPDLLADDWSEQAGRLAALGNPVRLRILHAVMHGANSAARIAEEVEVGTSGQVYHHLKELTAAGWLSSPKRGHFEVPASRVVPLLAVLLAAGTPSA
ncbi:winged helix-turn-helix domain-containing protein [Saxibacter everestensis]|uniref:Winged helix-turn-helix domain-containing protein n=1 Tax=Saxibacter everestensis TaxID=2909229 RepID=A0ABY8QY25_9MICO|nr:winged helix-turn-helix domain-containing protein [Brevibacteriaceae bacterium ZFBP1038]